LRNFVFTFNAEEYVMKKVEINATKKNAGCSKVVYVSFSIDIV